MRQFPLAERARLRRAEQRNDGHLAGVRFFGVRFERIGDRRQGVALPVGVPGGLGGGAHQLGQLFHPPRRAAAAFDVARAAGGQQSRVPADRRQHAEPIATDHAAAFVGHRVRGRRELDAAMHERAEPDQLVAVAFVLPQSVQLVERVILGRQLADGREELLVAAIGGRAGVGARGDFENRHGDSPQSDSVRIVRRATCTGAMQCARVGRGDVAAAGGA